MFGLTVFIGITVFCSSISAHIIQNGQCNNTIQLADNFNFAQFIHNWYVIARAENPLVGGDCSNVQLTNFNPISATQAYFTYTSVDRNFLQETNGNASVVTGTPRIEALIQNGGPATSLQFDILVTDNINYAVGYRCENISGTQRRVYLWQLNSIRAAATAAVQTIINTALNDRLGINGADLQSVDHSDNACYQLPTIPAGQPIVLAGQCGETIVPVLADFNITGFLGTWHEISSYYSANTEGVCPRAEYTAGTGNIVNIANTEVVGQELRTIFGTATRTDNTGRLQVTLTVSGIPVNQDLYIIATDYSNYTVTYSCRNINGTAKQVFSWILGRSPQLSAAAVASVDSVVNSMRDLNHAYYQEANRTDEDCFYFPDPALGGDVIFRGQCSPNITPVTNFNAANFAGRWFDIESYYAGFAGSCIDSRLTLTGTTFNVIVTQVINRALDTSTSQATVVAGGTGRLTVTTVDGTFEYLILATDYQNYTLVYSCSNVGTDRRSVRSWKLSRTRTLSDQHRALINAATSNINVLDERYYNPTSHSETACFYLPTPVPGQVVRFRGTCDETIQAVSNFQLANYTGLWHNIENYPQPFQTGNCARAQYTQLPNQAVFEVVNSQVINQELDTIIGSAVPNSADGSARLAVTFPSVSNASVPYWVLATDYISYALVYSCSRFDDEYISVAAWKLSRQQTLTDAARTAINTAMLNIPVLEQQYFEETNHTDQDCFYYPVLNYGEPVILSGQCPDYNNIDVVTNFNTTAFAGTWHEISRFHSELQSGHCASSSLTIMGTNAFSLTQSIVLNETLITSTGPAVTVPDGRGTITINVAGSGTTTNINVHILDTVYNDFALAYSCRQIDATRKQIYSWKLSRNRAGLSTAANVRINQIVAANPDLREDYYRITNQSNDGCFHYPVFNPLPEVIELPGPCDERIRGIANFNVTAYLGLWHEIKKYPQPFQTGTCSRAVYSVPAGIGNAVMVTNTDVVNQTLQVQSGAAVVASSDGTGVLNVSFVVGGVTVYANYYILETDYSSFAVVYSCRNLVNGNSQVGSWILSRYRGLTHQARDTVNDVIANTRGLRPEYYTQTNQGTEECFYVPERNVNSAPVFRGRCDPDVESVPNFNMIAFLGWWHEIERYPVDHNIGECASSQIAPLGNAFNAVDTDVIGLVANVTTSSVHVLPDNTIRRVSEIGTVVDTFVLATDYQNYALLYSCESFWDENGELRRRVWSAKHSRARSLTAASQTAMASVIQNNQVLIPEFYLPVNQSDSACFHYPDPTQIGERVILPGQCDNNIPVVPNFMPGSYNGTWYLIENYPYPQPSDNGTCIGTRYTHNATTNVITVLNWEVVNGSLVTVEGSATVASDNSGRLTVTLPSGDGSVTRVLHILATDYTSFSLALTCENVNQFQRAVVAFKLSRTRTMLAAANQAINAVIAQREELHQPYFVTVEQNEDCIEPSSGILVKSSIIVLLICSLWNFIL